MQATSEQLVGLTKLQHVDLSIARLERRLDELPQKQGIADIRAKRAAIQQKLRALVGTRKDDEDRLRSLREEDASAADEADAAQRSIEAAAGDYRAVTAGSARLEELAARRQEIAAQIDALESRLASVADMEPQAASMLERLDERERDLVEAYRREGGALLAKIAELKDERTELADAIGADIMAHYTRLAKAKQGVALAHLVDGACNTCRASIDPSRVLILRSEYPLSFCPHCGRLMVVDRRYTG